ncbi:MAG: AMP-binding protein [Chloroflexota bacterium]
MPEFPRLSQFESLVGLLDDAAQRWPAARAMYSLRTDDGIEMAWSASEMRQRSMLVAWRLRALGLEPSDRLLTWSPSTPRLPAVYWGAMRAGVIVVPLDLRMTSAVIERISARADTKWLAIDTGFDTPDPAEAGLDHFEVYKLADLTADVDDKLLEDWEQQVEGWPMPDRDSLFEVVFTSGTTADPKGVLLTHGNILETIAMFGSLVEPREQRSVSILPLSHLFEQAPLLFYGTSIGAEVVYVRSRNPRIVFEALRETRVTTMVLTPQILELFWNALTREIERLGQTARFERARSIARHLPYRLRRIVFRRLHSQLGGELRVLVSAGAYLPPELQEAWEDVGIAVVQGYGSTECGIVTGNNEHRHPVGVVGYVRKPVQIKLHPETSEILVKGPNVSSGYWRDEEATAAARDADGWTLTGDVGHFNDDGDLVLSGRLRNIIVLPSGLNVYPEDVEAALTNHGLTQTVVLETSPGRIEAVVLPPGSQPVVRAEAAPTEERSTDEDAQMRAEIDRIVKAANADLAVNQRIAGWRLWPDPDFPRTHTLKIRRNEVRAWAGDDIALQVRESETDGES